MLAITAACASGTGGDQPDARANGDGGGVDAQRVGDAGCVALELLGNGDFENGSVGWSQSSSIIRGSGQLPFAPHDGASAAMFGVSNSANDVLTQTVSVPSTATRLRLSGYECHVTTDAAANADRFAIDVTTAGGSVLENLVDLTNSDVAGTCSWTPFERVTADSHAGDDVTLRLTAQTNATALTRFIVDSLALEALVCP